jgi:hypothetical protein
MLFAESQSSGNFGLLFFVFIMFLGARQWIKWFKGSPQLRNATKKAGGGLLRWLLK